MTDDIIKACELLERGKIILYPTDTVWGIGCDATDSYAVKRIYEIKHRSDSKAFIVLSDSIDNIADYLTLLSKETELLLNDSSRPTTVVTKAYVGLAPELLAEDGTVGVRITHEEFSSQLCRHFGRPIVSTSANVSGYPTPATFDEISDVIKDTVDYICTSRRDETEARQPSRVIKVEDNGNITILRP